MNFDPVAFLALKNMRLAAYECYDTMLEQGWTAAETRAVMTGSLPADVEMPQKALENLMNLWIDEYEAVKIKLKQEGMAT